MIVSLASSCWTLVTCSSYVMQCEELAGHLVRDMEKEGLKGKTLILKLKETSFAVRTRSVTLPHYTSSLQEILQVRPLPLLLFSGLSAHEAGSPNNTC